MLRRARKLDEDLVGEAKALRPLLSGRIANYVTIRVRMYRAGVCGIMAAGARAVAPSCLELAQPDLRLAQDVPNIPRK